MEYCFAPEKTLEIVTSRHACTQVALNTVTQNCTKGQQVEMGVMHRLLQHVTYGTDAHAIVTHSISLLHVAAGKPHRSLLTFWSVLNLGTDLLPQSTAKAILPKQQVHILCSHQQLQGHCIKGPWASWTMSMTCNPLRHHHCIHHHCILTLHYLYCYSQPLHIHPALPLWHRHETLLVGITSSASQVCICFLPAHLRYLTSVSTVVYSPVCSLSWVMQWQFCSVIICTPSATQAHSCHTILANSFCSIWLQPCLTTSVSGAGWVWQLTDLLSSAFSCYSSASLPQSMCCCCKTSISTCLCHPSKFTTAAWGITAIMQPSIGSASA